MRRNSDRLAVFLFTVGGIAWLAYKSEYLRMPSVGWGAKALFVAPGLGLWLAAAFVAFPDARRRRGGSCVAVGAVALLTTLLGACPTEAWFPYAGIRGYGMSVWSPRLVATMPLALTLSAGILPPMGFAILSRRSVVGGLLLGMALWLVLVPPSRIVSTLRTAGTGDMPRRYAYYYLTPQPGTAALDVALPALLALAGLGLLLRKSPSPAGTPPPEHRYTPPG